MGSRDPGSWVRIPGSWGQDPGIPGHGSWVLGSGSWDPGSWIPDPGTQSRAAKGRSAGRWTLALSKHPPGTPLTAGYPGRQPSLSPGTPRPSACQGLAAVARTADPSPTRRIRAPLAPRVAVHCRGWCGVVYPGWWYPGGVPPGGTPPWYTTMGTPPRTILSSVPRPAVRAVRGCGACGSQSANLAWVNVGYR